MPVLRVGLCKVQLGSWPLHPVYVLNISDLKKSVKTSLESDVNFN